MACHAVAWLSSETDHRYFIAVNSMIQRGYSLPMTQDVLAACTLSADAGLREHWLTLLACVPSTGAPANERVVTAIEGRLVECGMESSPTYTVLVRTMGIRPSEARRKRPSAAFADGFRPAKRYRVNPRIDAESDAEDDNPERAPALMAQLNYGLEPGVFEELAVEGGEEDDDDKGEDIDDDDDEDDDDDSGSELQVRTRRGAKVNFIDDADVDADDGPAAQRKLAKVIGSRHIKCDSDDDSDESFHDDGDDDDDDSISSEDEDTPLAEVVDEDPNVLDDAVDEDE